MALSRKSKIALLVLAAPIFVAGCAAEYTNNWDSVSSRTGNASQANTAIQEVTAWPRHVNDVDIEIGG